MDKEIQNKLLKVVAGNYQAIGQQFNETRKKPLWPSLSGMLELVPSGASVLDVGCGNGRLRKGLVGKGVEYVGVEPSTVLLELAQQDDGLKLAGQKFFLGNILEMENMEIGLFDWVFSVAVIHHLPGRDLQVKGLESLAAHLKPGGRIVVTVWSLLGNRKYFKRVLKFAWLKILGKNRMDFGDILFGWGGQGGSQRYYHAFTKRGLKKIINKAGLRVENMFDDGHSWYMVLKK